MKAFKTRLPEVLILEPDVYEDERGFFLESYNQEVFNKLLGKKVKFVQDNHSKSAKGVLRGLHYQRKNPQGKLVRVTSGSIFDVVVDIRKTSSNFGEWIGVKLTHKNKKQIWFPRNFAHGFYVLEENTEVLYKATDFYNPKEERTIRWDDQDISIDWPIESPPTLSSKDKEALGLKEADLPE